MDIKITHWGFGIDGVTCDDAKTRNSDCRKRLMSEAGEQGWEPLLAQVNSGHREAERELVRRLWPQVTGRIAGLCPRREEIEDLAQDVYVKNFQKLDGYRGGSFKKWVDVIARRVCYDALRKQRVRPEWRFADLDHFDPSQIEGEPSNTRGEDARRVLGELFRLMRPEQAWLLQEVELKERSIGKVAKEMGWTEVAGRLRLMRARRSLVRTFGKWEHEAKNSNEQKS